MRDAITAIHNLEVLLKSPRIGTKVLAGVLHEFLTGISVLRGAFSQAAGTGKTERALAARGDLAAFAHARLDELERSMRQALTADFDARARLGLEQVVTRVSVDLDAAAELLDLSERAEHALPTELNLRVLAAVTLRAPRGETDGEIFVRLAPSDTDCVTRADSHVFKRMVSFAVGRAVALGAAQPVLRVHCDEQTASITVGPAAPGEEALPATPLRLVRPIEPTDAVMDAAAESVGIEVKVEGSVVTLAMPRV